MLAGDDLAHHVLVLGRFSQHLKNTGIPHRTRLERTQVWATDGTRGIAGATGHHFRQRHAQGVELGQGLQQIERRAIDGENMHVR